MIRALVSLFLLCIPVYSNIQILFITHLARTSQYVHTILPKAFLYTSHSLRFPNAHLSLVPNFLPQCHPFPCSYRHDVQEAQRVIQELFHQVLEIRRKADQSESIVNEICRDIRKLDHAKQHLTHTISALSNLSQLITSMDKLQVGGAGLAASGFPSSCSLKRKILPVAFSCLSHNLHSVSCFSQVQDMVESRNYRDAAGLLAAVTQYMVQFESYTQIPKIAELKGRFQTIKAALKLLVADDFKFLGTMMTHVSLEASRRVSFE